MTISPPYLIGSKIKVLIQDVDRVRWKQELEEDELLLVKLLREAREIDASRDEKLRCLKDLIAAKNDKPLNSGNKKVLIFTAFTDTAQYLYKNVAPWALDRLGLHSAMVTGGNGGNKTTMPALRKDMATIITSFSPLSKERAKIDMSLTDEIDILISTDCLSEARTFRIATTSSIMTSIGIPSASFSVSAASIVLDRKTRLYNLSISGPTWSWTNTSTWRLVSPDEWFCSTSPPQERRTSSSSQTQGK